MPERGPCPGLPQRKPDDTLTAGALPACRSAKTKDFA